MKFLVGILKWVLEINFLIKLREIVGGGTLQIRAKIGKSRKISRRVVHIIKK
jgi:hypothetical protein